jgi:hypothetical protein
MERGTVGRGMTSLDGKRYSGEGYDITGWKEVGRGMTRYITL